MRDTFEHLGYSFKITLEPDSDAGAPWDNEDGHGPVSAWRYHGFGQGTKPPKAPGERILVWDHGSYRTYDFAAAVRIARRDGWDAEPYKTGTKGQRSARAAEADFKRMRDFCNGDWGYVGVIVELLDDDDEPMGEQESVWGVESDGDYYLEVANELAADILHSLANRARKAGAP